MDTFVSSSLLLPKYAMTEMKKALTSEVTHPASFFRAASGENPIPRSFCKSH